MTLLLPSANRYTEFLAARTRQSALVWLVVQLLMGIISVKKSLAEGSPGGVITSVVWAFAAVPPLAVMVLNRRAFVRQRQKLWMFSFCVR